MMGRHKRNLKSKKSLESINVLGGKVCEGCQCVGLVGWCVLLHIALRECWLGSKESLCLGINVGPYPVPEMTPMT